MGTWRAPPIRQSEYGGALETSVVQSVSPFIFLDSGEVWGVTSRGIGVIRALGGSGSSYLKTNPDAIQYFNNHTVCCCVFAEYHQLHFHK